MDRKNVAWEQLTLMARVAINVKIAATVRVLSAVEETAAFYLKRLAVMINAVDHLPSVAHSQMALKHVANLVAKPMELAKVKNILKSLDYIFMYQINITRSISA